MVWSKAEHQQKIERIRELLRSQQVDAVLLEQGANFAWLTGGRGFVAMGSELARASILITEDRVRVITSNIEAARFTEEELDGLDLEVVSYPWFDVESKQEVIRRLSGKTNIITEQQLGLDFDRLRWNLLPGEIEIYRQAAKSAAEAISEVCRQFRRGDSELEVAGLLAKAAMCHGLTPSVILVGADERAYTRRHPMPTKKPISGYALLAMGAHLNGLFTSTTRLVHFGPVPEELRRRHDAVCRVDATLMSKTVPGNSLGGIFQAEAEAYEAEGFKDEWKNHHQGGITGYQGREVLATPGNQEIVQVNQAFAWNPTISGVKSEDTLLVTPEGLEVLTVCEGFPLKKVSSGGFSCLRPDILVR